LFSLPKSAIKLHMPLNLRGAGSGMKGDVRREQDAGKQEGIPSQLSFL
jgi:hypothetical protein